MQNADQNKETLLDLYMSAIYFGIGPVLISIILSVVCVFIVCKIYSRSFCNIVPLVVAFSAVGGGIGYFTGSSRDSVVGVVAPGMLTFVSGIAAYLFTKDGQAVNSLRRQLPLALGAMFFSAVFTASISAMGRIQAERGARFDDEYYKNQALNNENTWKAHFLRLERLDLPFALAKRRRDAGLPDDPGSIPRTSGK